MNNTKEYIAELEKEILNATLGLVKSVFESNEEIIPHLIFANEDTITSGIKDNTKFGIGLAHVGQIFCAPKPIRNLLLEKLFTQIKPVVISLIIETWYVEVEPEKVTNKENPLNGVQPKDHPERQDAVLIQIVSPFRQEIIQYPIISDFLNIKNGVPKKYLGERRDMPDMVSFKSFFTEIYKKTAQPMSDIERIIQKL